MFHFRLSYPVFIHFGLSTYFCPGLYARYGPNANVRYALDQMLTSYDLVHYTPPQELCQRRPKTNQLSRWLIKPSQINPEETQNFEQLKPVNIFIINTYNKQRMTDNTWAHVTYTAQTNT